LITNVVFDDKICRHRQKAKFIHSAHEKLNFYFELQNEAKVGVEIMPICHYLTQPSLN